MRSEPYKSYIKFRVNLHLEIYSIQPQRINKIYTMLTFFLATNFFPVSNPNSFFRCWAVTDESMMRGIVESNLKRWKAIKIGKGHTTNQNRSLSFHLLAIKRIGKGRQGDSLNFALSHGFLFLYPFIFSFSFLRFTVHPIESLPSVFCITTTLLTWLYY